MPHLYNTALLHIGVIAAGPRDTGRNQRFIVVSSLICLGFGLVHLLGMAQRWSALA